MSVSLCRCCYDSDSADAVCASTEDSTHSTELRDCCAVAVARHSAPAARLSAAVTSTAAIDVEALVPEIAVAMTLSAAVETAVVAAQLTEILVK